MSIATLLTTNVNEHTERKQNLTYLSWAWAWAEALKADPKATYKVEMFGDKCFMDINGTAMVWVTVTIFDKAMTCQLPVMDHRNKAIPKPDAFQVNTAIMRCMTKALSLHGLGLYIYAGEDLPEGEEPAPIPAPAPKMVHRPIGNPEENVTAEEQAYLRELASRLTDMVDAGSGPVAAEALKGENLEEPQKLFIWSLLPSHVRSAIKKG
jgi:hypothetical protein